MKTVCAKPGKGGKIHPSPPGGDVDPTTAALRLLPAAILALTAALGPEDQQVLAYLVTSSLQGAAVQHPEQPPVRGRRRRAHPPAIGCGCFDCYTSFWSRWDCSPDRELIHDAIDAFEDHLAAAESSFSATPSSSSKRRDKGKRKAPPTPPPMSPKSPEHQAEKVQEPYPAPASPHPPPPPAPAASTVESDEEEKVPEDSSEAEAEVEAEAEAEAMENAELEGEEEERKRGWADVLGMLNLRLWGIWSPAVESAT